MKNFTIKHIFNPSDILSYNYSKVLNSIAKNQINIVKLDIIIGGFPVVNKNLKFTEYDEDIIKKYNLNFESIQRKQQENLVMNNDNFIFATAMCIFKERFPEKAVEFSLQLHKINLSKKDKIKSICSHAQILGYNETEFKNKLSEKKYKLQANYEFETINNKIVINSYPVTIIELEGRLQVMFSGYICINRLKQIYEEPDKKKLFYSLKNDIFIGDLIQKK